MRAAAGDLEAEPIREMVADHARIRGLVMTLLEDDRSGEVSPDTLRKIGERLEDHIRLEERRVFPLVLAGHTTVGKLGAGLRKDSIVPRADPSGARRLSVGLLTGGVHPLAGRPSSVHCGYPR